LNALMHRNHVDETGCQVVRGHLGRWFGVGEPVIHLRNDYAKGLFNGLIGRVTAVDEEARSCTVLFDGDAETHSFGTDQLLDLALAYAITCHKAQGSSAPRVVIPLYQNPVLDPSWVYTAMTRSEEQVVFVGDPAVMEAAIGRPWPAERRHVAFEWPAHAPLAPV
jgi:exodeoxyribonuclease V alpha subunit